MKVAGNRGRVLLENTLTETARMVRTPIRWREMEEKVREIHASALVILRLPRVPQQARTEAAEIIAKVAEILGRSNGD